jgi:hypothetical protein
MPAALLALLALLAPLSRSDSAAAPAPPPQSRAVAPAPSLGTNYDPAAAASGRVSAVSAPALFEVTIQIGGAAVDLTGDFATSSAGLLLLGPGDFHHPAASGCAVRASGGKQREVECEVRLVRFAQYGTTDAPRSLEWAALLEESSSASGIITGLLSEDGALAFPASIRLRPHLALVVRPAGAASPVRLRSRQPFDLEGTLEGWPPYEAGWPPRSLVLQLRNAPIAFYDEARIRDPKAPSFLKVTDLRFSLGTQPTAFFQSSPRLKTATPIALNGDHRGIELTWELPDSSVRGRLSGVNLYRNTTPRDPKGWRWFAWVPAAETRAVDPGQDGRTPVEYLISYRVDLPFNLSFEGAYSPPLAAGPP